MAQAGWRWPTLPVTRSPREAAEGRLISSPRSAMPNSWRRFRPVLRCYSRKPPLTRSARWERAQGETDQHLLSLGNCGGRLRGGGRGDAPAASTFRSCTKLKNKKNFASQGGADSAMMRWIIRPLLEDRRKRPSDSLCGHARKDLASTTAWSARPAAGPARRHGDADLRCDRRSATATGSSAALHILARDEDAPDRD